MILGVLRLFRIPSLYHYRTIIITILLPAIVPLSGGFSAPDILRVLFYVLVFLVWSVVTVLSVASMLKRDRSDAELLLNHKIEALSAQIDRLREEHEDHDHEDLRADLRQQVNDLEEVVRATLKENLGVVLPPRRVSLRAKAFHIGLSWNVGKMIVDGGSRVARFRQWVRRKIRRIWEVVYGKPENG